MGALSNNETPATPQVHFVAHMFLARWLPLLCAHDLDRCACMTTRVMYATLFYHSLFGPLTEPPLPTMGSSEGKNVKELPYVIACPSSYEVRVRCSMIER